MNEEQHVCDEYCPQDPHHEWIFTFCAWSTLSRCFVKIRATWSDARSQMVRAYGPHWAFQYASEDEAGVGRHRLREVPLGTDQLRRF
jgi:hypothetical protein